MQQVEVGTRARTSARWVIVCFTALLAAGCGSARHSDQQASTTGCTNCHGGPDNAAPPKATNGDGDTSSVRVGAHQAHLTGTKLRPALTCDACHVVPATVDAPGHIDGDHATVTFGSLARAGGASPEWSRDQATCGSTYCHGGTLQGGRITSPSWTKVDGSQDACGTCHGIPPPRPHVQYTSCGKCHSGYGPGAVAPATHIDGKTDYVALACNTCHGTDANAAPPIGTAGETETTAIAVGAHQAHVVAGRLRGPIACNECHVVPTDMLHANGTVDLAWGALATRSGATPAWDRASATCASTYCHGAAFAQGDGALKRPVWTKVDGTQAACGTCHGFPPPLPHPNDTSCHRCHGETVDALGNVLVGGGKHIDGTVEVSGGACSLCHGSDANPAPPVGTHGETATTTLAVGAHQQHVVDGAIRKALACSDCHVVPSKALHSNATVDMAWSALATGNGATTPALDVGAATCASTYCHGATLAGGGQAKTPVWTKVDGTQAACDSCHGDPPAAPHPANPACRSCHPQTVRADGTIDVAGGYHVNGKVDVGPLSCTSCHGTQGVNAAPPLGTRGETETAALVVGAHQAHVKDGPFRQAMACSECHAVPTTMLHANGTVELTFGVLAKTGNLAPAFSATAATCSANYCHGGSLSPTDGRLKTPVWTKVDGTQAACGTCHGIPPPFPHPADTSCDRCHKDTVDAFGNILVAGGKHVNGIIDVAGSGCTACHGSDANPAPPLGTHGETATTTLAVGAHQAHVADTLVRKAVGCADCHVMPTQALHANGTVDMAWSALATGDGATTPKLDVGAATCASTYCHGATLAGGGLAKTPVWTKVDGTQAACDSCHGYPPAAPHPPNPLCNSCHPATVGVDGKIDVTGGHHIDGAVDVAGLTCTSCHGSSANPAPPIDTRGNDATTFVSVGAHQAHLQDGPFRKAMACTECHAVPSDMRHANGKVELSWGQIATSGSAAPTFDVSTATCTNYCHGAKFAVGDGTLKTPVWNVVDGTQAACGTCHGNPPPAPHPQNLDCNRCHPATVLPDGRIDVASGHHVDGILDVAPIACDSCHGSAANPAPPIGTRGEIATTALAVGAHQAHVTETLIRKALVCADCHVVPSQMLHGDGTVDLAWSALATGDGATAPKLDAGTASCAATYCHGATISGGQARTPVWTQVDGTQAACDSCHGYPPPAPHPPNPLCNSCHPATVGVDGKIDVTGGHHIDGVVDVAGLTCSSCHGSTTNPAPPIGTRGETETTARAVGAHQAHLQDGPLRLAMACTECHVVPTEMRHANGTVTLSWGPLAAAGGTAPAFDRASTTCSNYCHGAAFRPVDGALKTPVWTKVDGSQAVCGSCHGNPPPEPHPQNAACGSCHPDTVDKDTGQILVAGGRHLDGRLEVSGNCGDCHGVPPTSGAHLVHAAFTPDALPTYGDLRILADYVPSGGPAYQFGCGNCHPTDDAKHMDLQVQVDLAPGSAGPGSLKSLNAPGAAYDRATGTCSGVYCHSSGQQVPAFTLTPGWKSGVTLGCDGCHTNPPAYASDGPGAVVANSHLALSDTGREFGHFAGLGGPLHDTKHGGGIYGAAESAAPITCQTCHYETTDPTSTGRSGFYWLDTTGKYELAGGDPKRKTDQRWKASQCATCHLASGPAPVGTGRVLPLRHVNGRRDVVFDPRTALTPYAGLPVLPDRPSHPYWVTNVTFCEPFPSGGVLDGTTMSFDLSAARWEPTTKTCTSVACHLADNPRWGGGYVAAPGAAASSCCQCHGGSRCGR